MVSSNDRSTKNKLSKEASRVLRLAMKNKDYAVRWSYTSNKEPTFGRYCYNLAVAEDEVLEAKKMGMTYIDIVHPDGRVEIKKGQCT